MGSAFTVPQAGAFAGPFGANNRDVRESLRAGRRLWHNGNMETVDKTKFARVILRIYGTGNDAPSLSGGVPLPLFGRFVNALPDLIVGRQPIPARLDEARVRVEEGSVKFVVLLPAIALSGLLGGGLREDLERLSSNRVPLDPGRQVAVRNIQKGLSGVEGGTFEVAALDVDGAVLAKSAPVGTEPLTDDTRDLFVEEEATLVGTAYDIGGKEKTNIRITDLSTGRDFVVRATREAVEHSTRPYERLRLLVRYRRNLRTGDCRDYELVRIIKAFDFETFRERLRAAIDRESRAWEGIDHAAWMSEMREC